jgi:phage recombination protein Bet
MTSSQALATRPPSADVSPADAFLGQRQLAIIKAHIAPGIPSEELTFFAEVCRTLRLNPILRQIYDIPRKSQGKTTWTIQIGIDGLRALAARSGAYAGNEEPMYGVVTESHGVKHPIWARVVVYRMVQGQPRPFVGHAHWAEFAPLNYEKTGYTGQWAKMPYRMLAKVAEAQALRMAFPEETSGVYIDAEMDQAGEIVTGLVVDADPSGVATAAEVRKADPPAKVAEERAEAARDAGTDEKALRDECIRLWRGTQDETRGANLAHFAADMTAYIEHAAPFTQAERLRFRDYLRARKAEVEAEREAAHGPFAVEPGEDALANAEMVFEVDDGQLTPDPRGGETDLAAIPALRPGARDN